MILCCIALMVSAQGVPQDTVWTDSTEYYSIDIKYPAIALENDVIGDRLEEYAMSSVDSFLQNFDESLEYDPIPMIAWTLDIYFTHEPSPQGMVTVVAWTYEYSGGAHPNNWTVGFNYDEGSETFLGTVELLGGEEALESLASAAIEELKMMPDADVGWIIRGASASPTNYHTVIPVPDVSGELAGYRVYFSPYQVACYACGTQEVYVPVEDL